MREAGEVGDILRGYAAPCDGDRRRGALGAFDQVAGEEAETQDRQEGQDQPPRTRAGVL